MVLDEPPTQQRALLLAAVLKSQSPGIVGLRPEVVPFVSFINADPILASFITSLTYFNILFYIKHFSNCRSVESDGLNKRDKRG